MRGARWGHYLGPFEGTCNPIPRKDGPAIGFRKHLYFQKDGKRVCRRCGAKADFRVRVKGKPLSEQIIEDRR